MIECEHEEGAVTGNLFEELNEHTSFTNSDDLTALPPSWRESLADAFVMVFASWPGIAIQVVTLVVWIWINHRLKDPFDPYPYGFFGLLITFFGLIATMLVLMSTSRADARLTSIINELRQSAMKDEAISSMIMESQFQIIQQNEQLLSNQQHIIHFLKAIHAHPKSGTPAA